MISTVTVSGSTLSANSAFSEGGGIYNGGGMVTVSGSTLSGNSALQGNGGGGIYNGRSFVFSHSIGGTVTVSGSTLSGNSAGFDGGGIFNDGAATISDSVFCDNSPDDIFGAYTDGGGNTFC